MPSSTSSSSAGPTPTGALGGALGRWGVGLLSLALPFTILGLGFAEAFTTPAVSSGEIVRHMDTQLATRAARVVLIGNSELDFAVDEALLARELGVHAVSLTATGTAMPYWYAVLKNRVYAQGHRPDLVIVMGDFSRFVEARTSILDAAVLLEQLAPEEPVIGRKVFGDEGGSLAAARWRGLRVRKRDALLEATKDAVVGLFFGEGGLEARMAQGDALSKAANATVLEAPGAVDLSLRQRVIPVSEAGLDDAQTLNIEATLVPDALALAAAHGSTLLFVRAPLRSDHPALAIDDDQARGFAAQLAQSNSALEFAQLDEPLGDQDFIDRWHLKPEAARRYTFALAAEIKA